MRWERLKPAAPIRVHLFLAAALWTLPGIALFVFGLRWALLGTSPWTFPLIVVALIAGYLKARLIMVRAADRTVQRIHERGDGRCLGGFLSWKSWLLVAVMATMGRYFRSGVLPLPVAGIIYTFVGTALLTASLVLWRAWREAGVSATSA